MPPKTGRKPRISEYGKRLATKQAAKQEYGVRERQFRRYFEEAHQVRGATGSKLLELLERRLDNVIYRLGLSQTRRKARQWISHGHCLVNQHKVTIPSYRVSVSDVIEIVSKRLVTDRGVEVPAWLKVSEKNAGGTVVRLPERAEIAIETDEQMIVEFYSR